MNIERLSCTVLGFILGFFAFGLPVIFTTSNTDSAKDESKFQIVDKYKNCDVIQYSLHDLATYKYFLHCSTPQ